MANVSAAKPDERAELPASLDEEGIPKGRPASAWWSIFSEDPTKVAMSTHAERAGFRALALAAARFTRPDGSMVFGPSGACPDRVEAINGLAEVLGEPGLATLAWWWSGRPRGGSASASPPLPAFGHSCRPLALLRENWADDGDLLAVDARDPTRTGVELMIGGRALLGPEWPGPAGAWRLDSWTTTFSADCVEWSSGTGANRVARVLVLLRGRGIAIVAEEKRGTTSAEMQVGLWPGVVARPITGSRAQIFKPSGGGRGVGVIPLSLAEGGAGSLVAGDSAVTLTVTPVDGRCWLPLLFSWHESRSRRSPRWRPLTVSEDSKICSRDVAFAARVTWGPGDTLVIYRSLAKPARRSFLGYQTTARFLVGTFSEAGDLRPLLSLD